MKYRHIVFDIDGTLTDTEMPALVSLADVIRAHKGVDVAPEELKFALGIPGADAFKIIGFEEEHFAEYMAEWERGLRAFNDQIDIFPGGKTGMTAGLVDSFIYAGSALAGALAGGVYEGFGVSALVIMWIAASALSIVMMRISGRMNAAYWKKYD